jgi:hypothetical protein
MDGAFYVFGNGRKIVHWALLGITKHLLMRKNCVHLGTHPTPLENKMFNYGAWGWGLV